MNYEILTTQSVIDTEEERFENLVEEQGIILKANEYALDNTAYKTHFFESVFHDDCYELMTIKDAIQSLATKEGIDLVQYDNGNIGFVSYYNDEIDAFEIMNPTTEEIFRYDEGDYNWANERR